MKLFTPEIKVPILTSITAVLLIFTPETLKAAVKQIESIISSTCLEKKQPLRWSAVKLIEGDAPTLEALDLSDTQLNCLESIVQELETNKIDREMVIADQKYKFICDVREKAVKRTLEDGHMTLSDKIDSVVTNKYLAIPLLFRSYGSYILHNFRSCWLFPNRYR